MLEDRDCPECGDGVPFERVECGDGHGQDCPDLVCTGCGLVLVPGLAPAVPGRGVRSAA